MSDLPSQVDRIRTWNARFDGDLVLRKYAAMRCSAFTFLRGTNHLFFDDWPGGALDDAPSSWICGDLHLENFGVYKADNGLQYFDVNDFDEACLAPVTRDVARFLTAILVAAPTWKSGIQGAPHDALHWCRTAVDAYAEALKAGKPHDVERELATGIVHKLFEGARRRTRRVLLDAHTVVRKHRRSFVADHEHVLPATADEIALATALLGVAAERLRAHLQTLPPHFFDVHDVARRVAGIGSLGARRYAVVIEGQGSPHRNVLLDIKEALPGTAARGVPLTQPVWGSNAERVVTTQRRAQGEPPAFLSAVTSAEAGYDDGASFMVRRLQPIANKLTLAGRGKHVTQGLLGELACIAAWSHLRGVGWHGGPTADACMAFASDPRWRATVLDYAYAYAQTVHRDYEAFCEVYDAGGLSLQG
ncbi:MAG TPA: DUF2252 family protein [Gemmatimonadaceae bacterium]|nr:DUF2252 family protein [Gemmatimonadaceae bacterium]